MKTFFKLIMLNNNKKEPEKLNKLHSQCFIETLKKLKKIMFEESIYLIKSFYESLDRLLELSDLFKNKRDQEHCFKK
jgi:hypothetical protein